MRAIRLGALFPRHLNLNGDVSNREVLARYLGWLGYQVELVDLDGRVQPQAASVDFLVIGHGSIAAWNSIRVEFEALANDLQNSLEQGVEVLAVASGRDALLRKTKSTPSHLPAIGLVEREFEAGPSLSRFEVASHLEIAAGTSILGYLNTRMNEPVLDRIGCLTITSLHGPVLSRNLEWLHELAMRLVVRAGGQMVQLEVALKNEETALFGDLIQKIRALEIPLAGE